MKKYFQLFVIGVCVIIMQSCNNSSNHPYKVKTLDSLSQALNSAESELAMLDTTLIFSRARSLDESFASISENKPDTIGREMALVIEQLLGQKKVFDIYRKKKPDFLKQIAEAKEQLKTLIHDIDKNLVAEDKVEEYFMTEKNKASQLIESAQLTAKTMNESLARFDSINAPVQQLVIKLKMARDSVASTSK